MEVVQAEKVVQEKVDWELRKLDEFHAKAEDIGCNKSHLLKSYGELKMSNRASLAKRRKDYNELKKLGGEPSPCFCCGAPSNHRHHVIWLKHGGSNSDHNIVKLCIACHQIVHPWMSEVSCVPKKKKRERKKYKRYYFKKKKKGPSRKSRRKAKVKAEANEVLVFKGMNLNEQIIKLNHELRVVKAYCGNHISRKNKKVRKLFDLIGIYKSINGADKMHHILEEYNNFVR